jgi:benzoyl-CoA reductase subunit D
MINTAGIDIGAGAIKVVLFNNDDDNHDWLAKRTARIRQHDPFELTKNTYDELLAENNLTRDDIAYCATTGEGESITYSTGHFYSMTTHARGAIYLEPDARAVLDIGALHGRAIKIDARGKVLNYKMTSQCASGSGQFLENIARYLGVAQDEIGELSQQSDDPEVVSSICAVLAETDVINMVSRGISSANILKGIHISMADRLAKLLKSIKAGEEGVVMATGGLALDTGLNAALNEAMEKQNLTVKVTSSPDSIFAGAIGAAIWGAFRYDKLKTLEAFAKAS